MGIELDYRRVEFNRTPELKVLSHTRRSAPMKLTMKIVWSLFSSLLFPGGKKRDERETAGHQIAKSCASDQGKCRFYTIRETGHINSLYTGHTHSQAYL